MHLNRFRGFCLVAEVAPLLGLILAIARAYRQGISGAEGAAFGILFVLTLLGIEVGFHRHFAHRSFRARPEVRAILAALGSMAFHSSVIWWVGIHRTHHRFSDQPLDPHSPQQGVWHAHTGWLFRAASVNPPRWSRRVKDLLQDPVVRVAHQHYAAYVALGLVLPMLGVGIITRSGDGLWGGFLWGGLVRMFAVNHISWSINSICHRWGTQPYAAQDDSRNNPWLALPSLGFSWHNNHHAFPASALNAHQWWQVDVSGWVILALAHLGWAWDVRFPSPEQRARKAKVQQVMTPLSNFSDPVQPEVEQDSSQNLV